MATGPASPSRDATLRRTRRAVTRIATVAGALALIGLIVALIVAAPSDDADAQAFDGTIRVSLLDRPQIDALRVVLGGTDVRISGSSLPLEEFLDVADSLRPVAP